MKTIPLVSLLASTQVGHMGKRRHTRKTSYQKAEIDEGFKGIRAGAAKAHSGRGSGFGQPIRARQRAEHVLGRASVSDGWLDRIRLLRPTDNDRHHQP